MTKEEVKIIVQKLKNAKASGIDGVIGEFFKYGGETVLEATWRLFRRLFEEEKSRRIGPVGSSSHSPKKETHEIQITIEG